MGSTRAQVRHLRFPSTRWLLVLGLILLVGVLVLGARLKSVTGPSRTDAAAARELAAQPATRDHAAFQRIAEIGSELPVLASMAVLTGWAATRRDRPAVAVALIGPTTALFLTEYVLKPLVDRESPKGVLSYPSGHAAIVAALVSTAVLFVYRYAGARLALLWSPLALVVVGAVALAVVVLRWHYITDSVGGVGLGVGVAFVIAAAADTVTSGGRRLGARAAVS